jgi:hypothetical protein
MGGIGTAIGGAMTTAAITAFAMRAKNVTIERESTRRAMTAIMGGDEQAAAAEMAFVADEVARLNINAANAEESYKNLLAAVVSTGGDLSKARAVFTGFQEAFVAMGVVPERAKLAMTAVQQIFSKGAVSMDSRSRWGRWQRPSTCRWQS